MRTRWRIGRLVGLALLAVAASSLLFCSPGYVIQAGIEEARILAGRQPIDEVIASPSTAAETRSQLELVRAARTFADRELGLDVGESYTTFSQLGRDTLLMVVTASAKDAFRPRTWWFPIVGRVPYKGFFDADDALREARKLEEEGYDTHVRPSGAFSTLGWFNDPLLSTLLAYDPVSLAATVIHEVTHNTTFIPGQVAFNESFANFVGDLGAAEYFCRVEGEDGGRCRAARALWQDNLLFADAVDRLVSALEDVYARNDLDRAAKIDARETVIARWRDRYAREVVPRLQVGFRTFHEGPINNASLMGTRLYYDRLELFDRTYRALGLPLEEAVARMIEAAESSPDAPFEAVERLATS